MIKVSKFFGIWLFLCLSMFFLSCNPSSTYLDETKFEEMRGKCISVLPDSYSFRLDVPFANCSLRVNVKNSEPSIDYYFFSYDTPANRDQLADWIDEQGDPKHINSNAILLDVKSMDDVFSYIKALYEEQFNNYQSSSGGRYLSTQIKYNDEYFFPTFFSCDIRISSFGINSPLSVVEPIRVTVKNYSVGN